ncbi:MAG: tetratricopeptide repeat protein [Bacteroides sp.]|nr:tetratricopeptide repeat protein [Bacteroides sp.]
MRKLFISFCLSICCCFLAAQNANPIQETMANYDYETALSLIDQETPTVPLLYQKGKALRGLGNNDKALSVFREIVAQDSLNPRAYIEAAECCKSLAKYREALDYYQSALKLNPDNKYVHLQYISLLMNMKRYRESLEESNLLAERDSSAYVLHLRAESMSHVYDNTEIARVVDAYLDIRRRYPEDYLSVAKLGNIYVAGRQLEDTIELTEEYRAIDSTNIFVNRINAQAYCLNKDYPKAIERYEQLLQEKDSTFQTCFYAGISYYAVEDFYAAHDLLERALKEDGSNINVLYYLGRACTKTSWKDEGVAYLKTAVNIAMPGDSVMARLYVGLADCYKMALQFQEQINTLLEQYNKYDRNNHRLLYDIAFVYYYQLRNVPKAEQYLEAYLKTRPKSGKGAVQEVDSDGMPIIGENNRYNAAEK